VKRSEVGERGEPRDDVVVDQNRLAELDTAVDHSVADGGRRRLRREPGGDARLVIGREVVGGEQRILVVEQAQLQRARARVDYEDDQTQSRTSGASSPSSRV